MFAKQKRKKVCLPVSLPICWYCAAVTVAAATAAAAAAPAAIAVADIICFLLCPKAAFRLSTHSMRSTCTHKDFSSVFSSVCSVYLEIMSLNIHFIGFYGKNTNK
uniref:Uncharacterized protein n=1 Tax=Glossina brevipalpis TaxID=37001 RepID=A0A1A9W1G3_9MUSC